MLIQNLDLVEMNTDYSVDLLREIAELTGIKIVSEMKYLGIELRITHQTITECIFCHCHG
jgi:hypothetical protein